MDAKGIRLGINVDHIATLRQARGEEYPSPIEGARLCMNRGADQITVHLREDRRHIQDADVFALRRLTHEQGRILNMEMGASRDVFDVAVAVNPDWICLVPEKREERTTEGGLDVIEKSESLSRLCQDLKNDIEKVKISLFVEADYSILQRAVELPIDGVEIHTGEYARSFLKGEDLSSYRSLFKMGRAIIKSRNLGYHAGHGLTDQSLVPLLEWGYFEEFNIGHWVISQAVFTGLGEVTASLRHQLDTSSTS